MILAPLWSPIQERIPLANLDLLGQETLLIVLLVLHFQLEQFVRESLLFILLVLQLLLVLCACQVLGQLAWVPSYEVYIWWMLWLFLIEAVDC